MRVINLCVDCHLFNLTYTYGSSSWHTVSWLLHIAFAKHMKANRAHFAICTFSIRHFSWISVRFLCRFGCMRCNVAQLFMLIYYVNRDPNLKTEQIHYNWMNASNVRCHVPNEQNPTWTSSIHVWLSECVVGTRRARHEATGFICINWYVHHHHHRLTV